ncbi:hypothetical protein QBC46DRAFT_439353 [Diplogelasinospora grovesii]|uniref:Uncharacterized protein n=1 Tax=Diplogelasinospora grovesii TaxID=303347 RepID=A0AAN6S3Q1_9PEZI|nr:hypothetical protein QBC46DRAFT_439353 [Diplogelasinospora grovesii]
MPTVVLQLTSWGAEQDAENFRTETKTRVESLRHVLYQQLYPPALRQIKSSYDDPGTFLTDGRWFNLYDEPVTSNRNFLTIHDYWIRLINLHTPAGDHASKLRAFRFVVSDPQRPLGPLEMHAYWGDRGNTRVLFYNYQPYGVSSFSYTNMENRSDTVRILFKLVPVQVDGKGGRRPVKLIPYREDNGARTRANGRNTWGTTWRLAVTSSPQ